MMTILHVQIPPTSFPLQIIRMDQQHAMRMHRHDFEELVIITGGSGTHFTLDDRYPIQAGDAFVIPRSQAHGYEDTNRLALVNILYRLERLCLPMAELRKLPGYHSFFLLEPEFRVRDRFEGRLRLSVDELSEVTRLIAQLDAEVATPTAGYEFLALASFMQLIGFLARCHATIDGNRRHAAMVHLGQVIGYLESHYTEEIAIDQLATMACMSKSTLFRVFRQAMGVTPIEHIVRLRILHAAELLSSEELSVTEAAHHVGFADSNYFTRQFRRIMGITPSAIKTLARDPRQP
ncbi:MAG TPA: helix-turn-helix domain-containing protein [Armatimonadota bacterium]|jgi:AraC-like DNA-binding protein